MDSPDDCRNTLGTLTRRCLCNIAHSEPAVVLPPIRNRAVGNYRCWPFASFRCNAMIRRLSEAERTLASHSRGRVYEFMPWIARHPQRAGAATIPLTAESLQSFWAHRRRDRHAAVRRVRGRIGLRLGRCAGRPSRAARGQPGPIAHPALWRDRHGGLVRGGHVRAAAARRFPGSAAGVDRR